MTILLTYKNVNLNALDIYQEYGKMYMQSKVCLFCFGKIYENETIYLMFQLLGNRDMRAKPVTVSNQRHEWNP